MDDPQFREGWTILHHACARSLEDVRKILTNKTININQTTSYGVTPLMVAVATMSSFQIVKYLIENGADKTLKTKSGKVAYDFLIFKD